MANGILGQLLGQSGGGQSLLGGGVFSTPVNRGERRLNLLGEAMQNFGGSPQTNLGASLGLLAGRGIAGLAGGEDPVLQRADKIRRVQSAIQQEGLDPVNTPNEFFSRTSELFEQEGLPDLAQQTRLQQIQLTPEPQEPLESSITVTGGTRKAQAFMERFPNQTIPEGETFTFPVVRDPNTGALRISGKPSRLGSGQTINVGDEELSPWQRTQLEIAGNRFAERVQAGTVASDMRVTLAQLEDVVTEPGFQSGAIQPLVTRIQGLAESVGIDLSGLANDIGIPLGELDTKEELNRLSNVLTTEMFKKFKGNLNDREVQIAQGAVTQLGKSPEANIRAIASLQAMAELSQEYSNRVLGAETPAEFRALENEKEERGVERFRQRRDQIEERMRERARANGVTFESTGGTRRQGNQEDRARNEIRQRAQSFIRQNIETEILPQGATLGDYDESVGGFEVLDGNGNVIRYYLEDNGS